MVLLYLNEFDVVLFAESLDLLKRVVNRAAMLLRGPFVLAEFERHTLKLRFRSHRPTTAPPSAR
jgi:hypothetical protein